MSESFYRTFSETRLSRFGAKRRERVDCARLALISAAVAVPGEILEIGPGRGTFGLAAVASGWKYRAVDASSVLAASLRQKGLEVIEAFVPPIPVASESCDVVHADQVLEHMPGIDAARSLTSEALRVLRPGGVFSVVVPDYLKERTFFWDVDYTHNFVTTERRVRQLLQDGGFSIVRVVHAIGAATGLAREALALAGFLAGLPGTDAAARLFRLSPLLFQVRKNLFATITFIARKPDQ